MAKNAKLQKLALDLPLFPITTAGSLPKPMELTELRFRVSRGIHQNSELDRKEKLSTEIWVRQQERFGFDAIVDGEMDRGDMVQHVAQKINGFEQGGTVRCVGNRYYRKPIVKSKIEWSAPLVHDNWRYAQRLTHKPVKAVLTGPFTLANWSFNEHYDTREALCHDLAIAINKELRFLTENNTKIIQLDELAFPLRDGDVGLMEKTITEAVRGINAYIIVRISSEGLANVWARMQRWPVDQFYIDMVNCNFEPLPIIKKTRSSKQITFGIVDSYRHSVEPVALLTRRIKKITSAIAADRIWFGTDFGLKTCSIEEATGKLKHLSEAVRAARLKHR